MAKDINSNATIAVSGGGLSMINRVLGALGEAWAESRKLDAEILARFGTFTARRVLRDKSGQIVQRSAAQEGDIVDCVPDSNGNIIAFPYVEHGVEVAEKWRATEQKRFMQRPGGRKTFWNADALDDPALEIGTYPLILTEGEPDAFVAIQCGFPLTVSCPDGAPPVPKGRNPADLDPLDIEAERIGKFEYIWNNRDRLRRVKRFILATDNDPPGRRLEAELLRRLSPARCAFVTYPEGCKDLNDVLIKFSPEAVSGVLNGAQPYPVRGLYRLSEYRESAPLETVSAGWPTLDQHFKPYPGGFIVVTGVPSHGKSKFVNNMVVNLARLYGWNSALVSPEMPVVPHLRDDLRKMVGKGTRLTPAEVDEWINSHILFIDSDPNGDGDDVMTLDWVIERATDAVLRDGIKILVVDPWNELEHARDRNETSSEYIGRSIRQLKKFARRYGVAVIVVAHPTKDVVTNKGEIRTPTLYDIDGAAAWFNKADHGIVVWRAEDATSIIVSKSRFEAAGTRGTVKLKYEAWSSRFEMLQPLKQEGLLGPE